MTQTNHSMQGKTCLVTGATRGLGEAAAIGLARMGAKVYVVGRSPKRVQATLAKIRAESGGAHGEGIIADLSSMDKVRNVAREFLSTGEGLDVLINNVGMTTLQYQRSADGFELTWALNYLSHFMLTNLLMPALSCAADEHGEARILELTSSMYRFAKPRLDHLHHDRGYNGVMAYSQSKRAMMLFTAEMAKRLDGSGISINVIAPGFVRTGIANGNGFFAGMAMRAITLFSLPLEEGVQPVLKLAADPSFRGVTGAYFYRYRRIEENRAFGNPEDREHLWQISEEACGLPSMVDKNTL